MLIRFSATGYEQDFNSGGGFAGHKYAAMFGPSARQRLTGRSRGAVLRQHREGRRAKPRPTTTSYEWAVNTTRWLRRTVQVQFKNLHTFDERDILQLTLTGFKRNELAALFGVPAGLVDEALKEGEVLPCLGVPEHADGEALRGVLDCLDRPVVGAGRFLQPFAEPARSPGGGGS